MWMEMGWEIQIKWAKWLGHPWESSVRMTHECCLTQVEILTIFIQKTAL